MDLVYIVSEDKHHNHIELRYSIRSMVKHLKGFERIVIVGHLPDFLKDVFHIPVKDAGDHNQAKNIYEKILAAAMHPEVSSSFACSSDDYFLLADFNLSSLPYYHCGSLYDTYQKLGKKNDYKVYVKNTYDALTERGHQCINFNVHFPIVYDKRLFVEHMTRYDWSTKKGFISKSLYCNSIGIEGEFITECKFHTPKTATAIRRFINGKTFFSTNEFSINAEMKEFLNEQYPSQYKLGK